MERGGGGARTTGAGETGRGREKKGAARNGDGMGVGPIAEGTGRHRTAPDEDQTELGPPGSLARDGMKTRE